MCVSVCVCECECVSVCVCECECVSVCVCCVCGVNNPKTRSNYDPSKNFILGLIGSHSTVIGRLRMCIP